MDTDYSGVENRNLNPTFIFDFYPHRSILRRFSALHISYRQTARHIQHARKAMGDTLRCFAEKKHEKPTNRGTKAPDVLPIFLTGKL